MGYLHTIEDPLTNTVLYTLPQSDLTGDLGFERRSGTYVVLGADYGVDPYGIAAAPAAIRKFSWQFRVLIPQPGGNLDAARDVLMGVVGPGVRHRLCYTTDAGIDRVVHAKCMRIQQTLTAASRFYQNFVVEWELLENWKDRTPRNTKVWGIGNYTWGQNAPALTWGDNTTKLTGTSGFITLIADGSDGAPVPTADDKFPIITLPGPFGGDVTYDTNGVPNGGGFIINNLTATTPDFSGAPQATGFQFLYKLTALDTLYVDGGSRDVLLNGADASALLITPIWQTDLFRVKKGVQNSIAIGGAGANQVFEANAIQYAVVTGAPTGGTVTLSVTYGGTTQTTAAIAYNATAVTVQNALNALTNLPANATFCNGGPWPAPIAITFQNGAANTAVAPLTLGTNSLTGGTAPTVGIPLIRTTMLALTGAPTGGTFTLTVTNAGVTATTTAIPYNAGYSQVYLALAALSNVGGAISVLGGGGPNAPWYLNFGTVLRADATVTVAPSLTGGTSPAAYLLTPTAGGQAAISFLWIGNYV